jgi:hypothetical protein
MGQVISLQAERSKRRPGQAEVGRLDAAVNELDGLVRRRGSKTSPAVERELLAIAAAVRRGRAAEAADRAERLVGLLTHPAASGG